MKGITYGQERKNNGETPKNSLNMGNPEKHRGNQGKSGEMVFFLCLVVL